MSEREAFLYRRKAEFFKALADETRLKILVFLRDGERCQCEILPYLDKSQSTVSQHLQTLRESDVLVSRKSGQRVKYRVRDPRIFQILKIVDGILLDHIRKISKATEDLV